MSAACAGELACLGHFAPRVFTTLKGIGITEVGGALKAVITGVAFCLEGHADAFIPKTVAIRTVAYHHEALVETGLTKRERLPGINIARKV